jgi:hypothetical protein
VVKNLPAKLPMACRIVSRGLGRVSTGLKFCKFNCAEGAIDSEAATTGSAGDELEMTLGHYWQGNDKFLMSGDAPCHKKVAFFGY